MKTMVTIRQRVSFYRKCCLTHSTGRNWKECLGHCCISSCLVGLQLECKAEVDHRENMVRTLGETKETMSVSKVSNDKDDSVGTSLNKEDNRDSETKKKLKTPKKPTILGVKMNLECDKQASVVS